MIRREAVFTFGTASRLTNIAALAEAASIVMSLPDDHELFMKLEVLNCESLVGYVLTKRGFDRHSSTTYTGHQFINDLTALANQLLADSYVKSCMTDTFGGYPLPDKRKLKAAIKSLQEMNK